MNKNDAMVIAEVITNEELQAMFENAKNGIKDWHERSSVNKSLTKGFSWNILTDGFDVSKTPHILAKRNMVLEFGDFLPDELKPKKLTKRVLPNPIHQDPKF